MIGLTCVHSVGLCFIVEIKLPEHKTIRHIRITASLCSIFSFLPLLWKLPFPGKICQAGFPTVSLIDWRLLRDTPFFYLGFYDEALTMVSSFAKSDRNSNTEESQFITGPLLAWNIKAELSYLVGRALKDWHLSAGRPRNTN